MTCYPQGWESATWDAGYTAAEVHDGELMQPIGFLHDQLARVQEQEPMNAHVVSEPIPAPVTEGVKFDQDKARIDLVAPEMIFGVAAILTFGAKKYGERNWEKGMSWGRLFAALMRHMWAWWGGKTSTKESFLFGELDMETGQSHLWHAGCCLMMLIAFECRGHGKDDRFGA